jgi:hypothetical protein
MGRYIQSRFEYPRYTDFFVLERKELTVKPRFAKIVEKEPHRRLGFTKNHELVDFYTESGTLLYLPDGPRYRYRRSEVEENCAAGVKKGQVVSAKINKHNRWASYVWPINHETFFKDIPEINDLAARVEKAHELGNIQKSELERVMPFINNQKTAHEILNEIMKRYKIRKQNKKIKVFARRCAWGGPTPENEPLDHTIFCYVGEAFYKRGESGPYMGMRIACIEFPGMDLLIELVKERCFPDLKK